MLLQPISDAQLAALRAYCRSMPRERHQNGRVELCGKKWRGHYYVYLVEDSGKERRAHRSLVLGEKPAMTKGQAQTKLREIIARETRTGVPDAAGVTLEWFWTNRFRPMREPSWKESAKKEIVANITRYVVSPLGHAYLTKIDKFQIQSHVNKLAVKYSKSVVEKAMVWTKAILEEAVEQDYITKNPARNLITPVTRPVCKRTLTALEIGALLDELPQRHRVLVLLCIVLGLRPGEAFALRWEDVQGNLLRVDEGMRHGKLWTVKTKASDSTVAMPDQVATELFALRGDEGSRDFVFPNSIGGVMRLDNFRNRVLNPAAERAGLEGITFQAMRRTCATMLVQHGNIKDVQAQLRHAQASTTLGVYAQKVPETVLAAVASLYTSLNAQGGCGSRKAN